MMGAKRFDVLRLPRAEFTGTDSAQVGGVGGDSTAPALRKQLFVNPDSDSLRP